MDDMLAGGEAGWGEIRCKFKFKQLTFPLFIVKILRKLITFVNYETCLFFLGKKLILMEVGAVGGADPN